MLAVKFSGNFLVNLLGVWAVSRAHLKLSYWHVYLAFISVVISDF